MPWTALTAQIEEFMFQNVAYRPTVYKTGTGSIAQWLKLVQTRDIDIEFSNDMHFFSCQMQKSINFW